MSTVEVLKSELDLFTKVSFQKSIENSSISEIRPTNTISESNTIEFNIYSSIEDYIDLQNIFLSVKGKLVKQDGTNYDDTNDKNRFGLIPYGLFTIWDQISIYLGQTLISQASNTQAYISYIEALLQATPDKYLTFFKAAGYVSSITDDEHDPDNVVEWYGKFFKQSKIFSLYGRFIGSIFNSEKLLLSGLDMRIILNRASNDFSVMGKEEKTATTGNLPATHPKLVLTDVSLFVRKVKVYNSIRLAHEQVLMNTRALYPFKRPLLKIVNLNKSQNVFHIANLHIGQMPSLMIVGITTNARFSGSHLKSPFKFNHHDLTHLCLNINNENFPKVPYNPDYDNDNYQREYYDFFLNIGCNKNFEQPAIDYINFKNNHALYAFNFNADFENVDVSEWISIPRTGFMNIELKFKNDLTEALKLICYMSFDNLIEIDFQRNVLINY